jgi:cell shape-determining protein MreC
MAVLQVLRVPIRSGRWIGLAARTSIELGGYVPAKQYKQLADQYQQLLNRTKTLEAALEDGYKRLEELAQIRQIKPLQRLRPISARIITFLAPTQLLIEAGKADGITAGDLVMADEAIIGKVVFASAYTAKVELLTSPQMAMVATVRPSNIAGLLKGDGNNGMVIRTRAPCPVKVGETVFLDDGPGKGLPVGTVVSSQLDRKDPLLWVIRVQPGWDMSRAKVVWVMTTGQ